MTAFQRVILTGILRAESNLHIGSGDDETIPDSQSLYNELVLDAKGLPYIPASTLRGLLRSHIEDFAIRERMFGLGRQKSDSEQSGNSGHARIYDALLKPATRASRIILSRTSIDPVTAAAKQHHLSSHRVVEPGAEFLVDIELDKPNKTDIEALLVALSGFGTASDWRLGNGKSIGQGKLSWQLGEIRVLREDKLKQWLSKSSLADSKQRRNTAKFKKVEGEKMESNKDTWVALFESETFSVQNPLSGWKSREIVLLVNSPILINDPQRVQARKKLYESLAHKLESENPPRSFDQLKQRIENLVSILDGIDDPKCVRSIHVDLAEFRVRCETPANPRQTDAVKELFKYVLAYFKNQSTPDPMYMRHQQQACIPGSTLKGWVRGHCRKILLTLQGANDNKRVDDLLDSIFGGTDCDPQYLRFDNALADVDEEKQLHPQTFNAVDRFTGGVKLGALFNVEAVWPEYFTGEVHYRGDLMEDWMKILLLYAIRDAEQGDLVLGWGKSKGYGQLRLKPVLEDLASMEDRNLERWHNKLLSLLN